MKKRLVIGISGATGCVYGIRMLQVLHDIDAIETHLIISHAAQQIIRAETDYDVNHVKSLASVVHDINNVGASIGSGSFHTIGMVIIPCTIKTLSGIANSFSDNLMIRAADVTLKEGRRLVLMVRETPFHKGHLRLMLQAADIGAVIIPAIPSFYQRPHTIDDIINQHVGRLLDVFDVTVPNLFKRWSGSHSP
jgi:4-hydroxy-3-polyprenylbenzoate decarboxylase